MAGITYLFPFVDCSDPVWIREYKKWCPGKDYANSPRFYKNDYLKYTFRGLAECMPWLENVIMLVSSESQVPEWLQGVEIVTHEQFIPKKYLPTFNSNAIEMFLADVPGLTDKIIYGNDDLIPVALTGEDDWFGGTKVSPIPKVGYHITTRLTSLYDFMVKEDWDVVSRKTGVTILPSWYVFVLHGPQPITKSTLLKASEELKAERLASIHRERNICDRTQKMYFDYAIATGEAIYDGRPDEFFTIENKNLEAIQSMLSNGMSPSIALSEPDNIDEIAVNIVEGMLNKRFPNKCKYEKGYEDKNNVNESAIEEQC